MIFRPKKSSILSLVAITAFVWGLGFATVIEAPNDYAGYASIIIAAVVICYLATEKIEIRDGKIMFFRYFRKSAEAEVNQVRAVDGKVGIPPLLRGLIVERIDGSVVGQIIASNYSRRDIDRIKDTVRGVS